MKLLRRAPLLLANFLTLLTLLALFAACGSAGNTGSIPNGFPATVSHPQPTDQDFHGCPPQGDGGDARLNVLKNRIDDGEKGTYHDVTLPTLLALEWPSGVEDTKRDNWSSADAAEVAQFEDVAVRSTGYILDVRHEGTESTNCHDVDQRDFHMWLAVNASDGKDKAMVVEVTPRVREQRPGWDDSTRSSLRGKQVRISGWLMLDQEHPEQVGKSRATIWEIHPILHIEVLQNNQWVSIDT